MQKLLVRLLVITLLVSSCFGILQKQTDKSERWYLGYGNEDAALTVTSKNVVGINDTSPDYKLDVNGDFFAITVNATNLKATNLEADIDGSGYDLAIADVTASGTITTNTLTDGVATLTGGALTGLLSISATTLSATYLGANLDAMDYDITNINNLDGDQVTASVSFYAPLATLVQSIITTATISYLGGNLDAQDYDITDIDDLDADQVTASARLYSPLAYLSSLTSTTVDVTNLYATNLEQDLDATGYSITAIQNISANGTVSANKFAGNIDDNYVQIHKLGSPTYDNSEDWFNTTQSSGKLSGGVFTDNADGSLKVSAGTGIIRAAGTTAVEPAFFFNWDEAPTLSVTDQDTSYIYIDYNSGTPTVSATLISTDCNNRDCILLGKVFREGTHLHMAEAGLVINEPTKRTITYLTQVFGEITRASGLVVSESGDRYLATTDGVLFAGLTRVTTSAQDTAGADEFEYYYYDGDLVTPAWVKSEVSTINNTQYNGVTTGLEDLTAQRYGVHWVYCDYDGHIMVVYGQGNYTLALASAANPPSSLPERVAEFGFIAAKIIIQKSATNFTQLLSAYDAQFTPSGASDHNELAGLQGGTATEYYHLTATDYGYYSGVNAQSVLTSASPSFVGVSVSGTVTANLFVGDLTGTATTADVLSSTDITVSTANYAVTANYATTVALANTVATANALSSYPSTVVTSNYYNGVSVNDTVSASIVNAASFLLSGVSINVGGTLTNVAYLDQANSFTTGNIFSSIEVTGTTTFTEHDIGNSGTAATADFAVADIHKITMTSDCTLVLDNGSIGTKLLRAVHGAAEYDITFSPNVYQAGINGVTDNPYVLEAGSTEISLFSFYFDGTYFYVSEVPFHD